MGFHLIDEAACLPVGQWAVRICAVTDGGRTQGGKFRAWLGLCCHGGNIGLGGLHGSTLRAVGLVDGLQTCNGLLCLGQPLLGEQVIGSLASSMALQRLRLLSACMCRRMGSGVVLFNAMAGAVCAAAD